VKTLTSGDGPTRKIDLLFMIDNSISMAYKQALLAKSIPALVERLANPRCIDAAGVENGSSFPCTSSAPEFSPVKDLHVGIITSSLGSHGGEVCVSNPGDPVVRAYNDRAELLPTVRTGLYSYQNYGFLVWDPRTGSERPFPDPHPSYTEHEQVFADFVADLTAHVESTGETGCSYEASLESWYRFLVDPEPISEVTTDGQFSVRGPVNAVVLQQRSIFMRPNSLLGIVMFTDENDCSILDENGQQGWLVGRRAAMPRGSDACAHPEDPNVYRCCIPCLAAESPGYVPAAGCDYDADVSCGRGGTLTAAEDSLNLRCYDQVRRFGVSLLYPWQRYVEALNSPRIRLRSPSLDEVTNPIYTPGADGTPAREPGLVFLAGIVGVPWQDIADDSSQTGRGLTYLTGDAFVAPPSGPNRWDVILGDPDTGRPPSDPFMVEAVDERPTGASNPLVDVAISPSTSAELNPINGHEMNIVNRDDLQYACTFPLPEEVPCTAANQDLCECNATEQAYNRPTCRYEGAGTDGTQTHGKAFPGVRQLQVLKGFGANAVVASICPKNVEPVGDAASDRDYAYNPALHALVDRFREALAPTCLPRPLVTENGEVPCTVVEASLQGGDCTCDASRGRVARTSGTIAAAVREELAALSLCGDITGVSCSDYCICDVRQLSGSELDECQNSVSPPSVSYGYCYVDPDNGIGNPDLVATCPETQRQIIRFVGEEFPAPGAAGFIACTGARI
jgi:hypothetical protein